ncbi:MAG: hypothetical protein MHM6MM_004029 [Cercozoa sp. M6MM]
MEFAQEHVYRHPWQRVVSAWLQKYPNSSAEHVKQSDLFERKFDALKQTLTSSRVITCVSAVPGWARTLGLGGGVVACEVSLLDIAKQKLIVSSRNLSFDSIFSIEEVCEYTPHENSEWTQYRQTARIRAFAGLLSSRVEKFSLARISQQAQKGLSVMESLCEDLADGSRQFLFEAENAFDEFRDFTQLRFDFNTPVKLDFSQQ